jgi:glycosyltransferase involved in cell wall biosynthesis
LLKGENLENAESVSVVITTYNYERFIKRAIGSVLGQTERPCEIVVVDDGSTDQTAAIVSRFESSGTCHTCPTCPVRYVFKENGGAGSARNRGIRETHGELIAFLDADDCWLPGKLALQLEHLRLYPAAGLVAGGEIQVSESGQVLLELKRPPAGAANLYRRLLVENIVGNPSLTLVRRACFERVGMFDETLRLGQDWDMWIRIAREFPIGILRSPLVLFMRHWDSLTAGQVWARYASNRAIHHRYIRQAPSLRERAALLRAAQSMNLFYSAAYFADNTPRRGLALGLALLTLVLDPVYQARLKLGLLYRVLRSA